MYKVVNLCRVGMAQSSPPPIEESYGGNKGKASWKMIGFPGIGAMYADKIEAYRNKKYMSEPLSIQDLL